MNGDKPFFSFLTVNQPCESCRLVMWQQCFKRALMTMIWCGKESIIGRTSLPSLEGEKVHAWGTE